MTNKSEPTHQEAKKRAKEYLDKVRKKFPVAPVFEDEPEGLLAGNPEKLKERLEIGVDKDEDEKPDLKIVSPKDTS